MLERMSRTCSMDQRGGLGQVGGGDVPGSSDEKASTEDEDDNQEESEESEEEESEEEETEDEESEEEETEEEETEDDVFKVIHRLTALKLEEEGNKDYTHKLYQKTFRDVFSKQLLWMWQLRRTPTYKKIMETAKELENSPENYDKEEALVEAVRRRKFLIDRLNPEAMRDDTPMSDDASETDDEEIDA